MGVVLMKRVLKINLLKFFHILPSGAKLFLRSFKKQEPEFYKLRWLVQESTIAVDIGANNGAYTYALGRLVGRNGLVVAIEPIVHLADYLRKACLQLRLPVDVKQICLSSKAGKGYLLIPYSPRGELLTGFASIHNLDLSEYGNMQKQEVKTKRLDDLLSKRRRRVSFIKCDVEGHELEVLKGSLDIIKTDRPNLLIEVEQRHHVNTSIYDVFGFLEKQEYKGYFIDKNRTLRDLREFYPSLHQPFPPDSKLDEYIYNFIFLPSELLDAKILRRIGAS
jgi:FkbM family methyltransferase